MPDPLGIRVLSFHYEERLNAPVGDEDGESARDLIQKNDALEGSPAYWALNDLSSQ